MKDLRASTFFLLSAFCVSFCFGANDPCQFVQHNKFINDPSSCEGYFRCLNGKARAEKCPNKLWFDKRTGECNFPSDVECEAEDNPCENEADGTFLDDPSSCPAYFLCLKGEAKPGKCSRGQHFNPTTRACVYKEDSKCDESSVSVNVCENIPAGVVVRDSVDCNKYYICLNNYPQKENCPDGLYMNLKTGICDKKENVECKDFDNNKPDCAAISDNTIINDPNSCAGYYVCFDGKAESYGKCPQGQWLVGAECKWSVDVDEKDCSNRCEGKKTGWVLKPSTKCKNYYNCNNGKINGNALECEKGKVFDYRLEACVDETGYKCPGI